MPTQNVNISKQQAAFIRRSIANGQFCNASEVMRAGLRALEQQAKQNELKLKNLRRLVQESLNSYAKGKYKRMTSHELDAFMDSLP